MSDGGQRKMAGRIRIENSDLVFELHGVDEFLSIKRSLSIPLNHVISVSTETVSWKPFRQLRVVGASLPGVVKDGRFLSSDGMMFFEMHDPEKCVTVTLDHERYKKIVFEVDDKEAAAKLINDAIKSQSQDTEKISQR
jgi:hypothetical protein